MNTKLITTSILVAGAMLFSGCSLTDYDEVDTSYDGGSTSSSSLDIDKLSNGFTITWHKNNGGYSEVIYTDDLDKERGIGYPLTSNTTGTFTMPCEFNKEDTYEDRVYYTCYPSNVTYSVSVKLQKNIEYKWLVSDGFEHTHGEVEFTMIYSDNELLIN